MGARPARIPAVGGESPSLVFLASVLFAGFLLLLAVLAFVTGKVTARREDGGAGCMPGCLIALVFGVLSLLAFGLFAAVLSGAALDSLVGGGPIERIGLWIDEPPSTSSSLASSRGDPLTAHFDESRPMHLIVDVRGEEIPTERLRRLVEEFTDGDAALTVTTLRDDAGRPLSRLDFSVFLDEQAARQLEEELKRFVEEFSLPGGAFVDFKGLRRTW